MLNKKIIAFMVAFVLFIGVGTVTFAVSKTELGQPKSIEGNISTVLLGGGYAADYADGMVLFSDADNRGFLTLRNTVSGNERIISAENSAYINVIGKNIYYITSSDKEFIIVKTTLKSEREVLVRSSDKLSNLFVSKDSMHYLKGCSVVEFVFSDNSQSVVLTEPGMKAFVPSDKGIYWFSETVVKETSHSKYSPCAVDALEGTEDEPIGYDCYLFNPQIGESKASSAADAIKASNSVFSDLSSLALTAKVGEKTLPTPEYPVGSYFTDNGNSCTDHRMGSCGWSNEKDCNCKAFYNEVSLKSIQCFAFARYVYYECFGEIGMTDSKTSTNIGSIPKGSVTEESFKALIRQTKPGAHLRVRYLKANGVTVSMHSMIILDWNESGFSVLESNVDGRCGVNVQKLSYSSYVPTVVSVEFVMMPDDYPASTEEETTTVPDVSVPVETDNTIPIETTESTSVPVRTEPVSLTQQTTVEDDTTSRVFEILFVISEKIIEFFAMIVNLLVSIL